MARVRNLSILVFLVAASFASMTTRVVDAGNLCYLFFESCKDHIQVPPNGHIFGLCGDDCPDFEQEQCCLVLCGGPYLAGECFSTLKDCDDKPNCGYCACA
jgi:hypothetical protein